MDNDIRIAYTEVDTILNLMDERCQKMIPAKLRILISENKLNDYNIIIKPNIPLEEQNISKKALAILSVLNYNYWCIENEKKQKLLKQYETNEQNKQRKLRELYNPDNLFNIKTINNATKNENKQLIIYEKNENFLLKLIKKVKSWFKKN